jgi:glycosyltransferase involved in cell wall biosynthesis
MNDLGVVSKFDPGFKRALKWDIELLEGYDHEFIGTWTGPHQDSFFWLCLKPGLKATLRSQSASVLWIQGWQVAAYWQAAWAANHIGIPLWLRGETNNRSNANGPLKGAKRILLKKFLNRVDKFFCIGEANRRFYVSQGISEDRLISAPYGVDNDRFSQQARHARHHRQALRNRWCIPENAFCFLFLGKLTQKKRPGDLVSAVRNLEGQGVNRPLHILFVGSGELEHELRQSCAISFDYQGKSGGARAPNVSFAGFLNQTEVSEAYVAADCLVLPSEATETWGLVVNEAMASGLPCIASDACGCVEDLITPVRPQLSYSVGNIPQLQRAMKDAMTCPPASQVLKQHIDGYSLSCTAEAVERAYGELSMNRHG